MNDELSLPWSGPYSWPDYEATNGLPVLPTFPGVYLWTAKYESGYLIYCAGITGRPFRKRFEEHTECYLAGCYTVLDIAALQQGQRCEVWHGWGYARSHREQFAERQSEIVAAAKLQMAAFACSWRMSSTGGFASGSRRQSCTASMPHRRRCATYPTAA